MAIFVVKKLLEAYNELRIIFRIYDNCENYINICAEYFVNNVIRLNVFGTCDFFLFVIKLINACNFSIKGYALSAGYSMIS